MLAPLISDPLGGFFFSSQKDFFLRDCRVSCHHNWCWDKKNHWIPDKLAWHSPCWFISQQFNLYSSCNQTEKNCSSGIMSYRSSSFYSFEKNSLTRQEALWTQLWKFTATRVAFVVQGYLEMFLSAFPKFTAWREFMVLRQRVNWGNLCFHNRDLSVSLAAFHTVCEGESFFVKLCLNPTPGNITLLRKIDVAFVFAQRSSGQYLRYQWG